MKNLKTKSDTTRVVHAGVEKNEHLAVVPPIYQTSTFKFENADHGSRLFRGEEEGFIYTRMLNPTVQAFENAIAMLENGHKSLACGSGMAAIHTVFSALLQNGDHIICSDAVYGPTVTLLETIFTKFGVEVTFVDTSNLDEIQNALRDNTKVIYVETPGNPTLVISDLIAISTIAKSANAQLVADNTFCSPILQKPLDLGADVVIHSLTKYLNGHADVVGGIVVTKSENDYKQMRKILNQTGGVLAPFDSFLVHRGIKTLAIRMERHCENAQKVAEFLENHSAIEWVRFPGLESHPQHKLAKSQMAGFGGMIAFGVKGGLSSGKDLMDNLELCQLAVSLGGVETLIQHPASMTHASMGKTAREAANITDGLVRISVGIENVNDIITDLKNALSKI